MARGGRRNRRGEPIKRKRTSSSRVSSKRKRKQSKVSYGEKSSTKNYASRFVRFHRESAKANSEGGIEVEKEGAASSGSESEHIENPLNDLITSLYDRNADTLDDFDSAEEEEDDEEEKDPECEEHDEDGDATADNNKDGDDLESEQQGEKEEESEEEMFDDDDEATKVHREKDPFCQHFERVLEESVVEKLKEKAAWETKEMMLLGLGDVSCTFPTSTGGPPLPSRFETGSDLEKLWVKPQLYAGWRLLNKIVNEGSDSTIFTPLQSNVFAIMNSYADLQFHERSHTNSEELRGIYCLHVLNHVLKTRARVVHHNSKLSRRNEVTEDYRDQGFTRPKILILVPFRESALRIVQAFATLLSPDGRGDVVNKKRFYEDFGDPSASAQTARHNQKPQDHQAMFAGNIDDNFRIGVAVTKKSLRLYADFYSTDIILASPLGLRILLGAEGEKNRDYDFLSSIEIIIADQADVMLMQNWEHILHCFHHLHLQPLEPHGADFSRIRLWALNGWGKHYRQTLCFTSFVAPEVNALFGRLCCNYGGIIRTSNSVVGGSIRQVAVQLPQVFQRFQSSSPKEDPEDRFRYFMSKVLPQYKEAVMLGTLIFVPSYFDFVRLRNHLQKEDANFVQVCEYSESGKVAQARDRFCHRERKFLLYTERAHFYHRYRIKGIRHIIFYQLPLYSHFYSELCNLTQLSTKQRTAANDQNLTCTVVYSRYDGHRLAAAVGTERASQMLSSDQNVHLFVTGDS